MCVVVYIPLPVRYYYCVFYRGRFSLVKSCTEKSSRVEYVAKIFKKHHNEVPGAFLAELAALSTLRHPRIVELHQAIDSSQCYALILERWAPYRCCHCCHHCCWWLWCPLCLHTVHHSSCHRLFIEYHHYHHNECLFAELEEQSCLSMLCPVSVYQNK